MNPLPLTPMQRLGCITDGLDPHVTEAIMLLFIEQQAEREAERAALAALADAQAVELRAYRRRESDITRQEEAIRLTVSAMQRLAEPDARLRLRGEEAMEWRRGLPEGGVR